MKRIGISLILVFILFTNNIIYSEESSAIVKSVSNYSIREAYKEILYFYQIHNEEHSPKYCLYDIEKDGIPELIIDCMHAGTDIYKGDPYGNATYIGSTHCPSGYGFHSIPNSNGLMVFGGLQGVQGHFIVTIENGKIVSGEHVTKDCWDRTTNQIYYDDAEDIIEGSMYLEMREITDVDFVDRSFIDVYYNGKALDFTKDGQFPIIMNGRTLVPARTIFEAMGAEVVWDESTDMVIAKRDKVTIKLQVGTNIIYRNNSIISSDVPSLIINNRTMVPARIITEIFGCRVSWNPVDVSVIIKDEFYNVNKENFETAIPFIWKESRIHTSASLLELYLKEICEVECMWLQADYQYIGACYGIFDAPYEFDEFDEFDVFKYTYPSAEYDYFLIPWNQMTVSPKIYKFIENEKLELVYTYIL